MAISDQKRKKTTFIAALTKLLGVRFRFLGIRGSSDLINVVRVRFRFIDIYTIYTSAVKQHGAMQLALLLSIVVYILCGMALL